MLYLPFYWFMPFLMLYDPMLDPTHPQSPLNPANQTQPANVPKPDDMKDDQTIDHQ